MRPRKKQRHLPACVYLSHGAYYLVKGGKWERLGTDLKSALEKYADRAQEKRGGMPELIRTALPLICEGKARNTASQYRIAAAKLQEIFADFSPEQVKAKHVFQLRRDMRDRPNWANRLITVLRMVFSYAAEEGIVDMNPAIGVTRLEEAKRDRLIGKNEYEAIYAKADKRLQVIMDLMFLTGQRVTDVLHIRMSDLAPEGIYFKQQKTGARLVTKWNAEIKAAVKRAEALHGDVRSLWLLPSRARKAPDYRSVSLQWKQACAAAGIEDAELRDLRAMSGTHAKQQGKNPTKLLGHTRETMTARYLRDREVPVVEGPSFRRNLAVKKNGK